MRRKTFGSDPFCTIFVRVRTITLIKPLSISIENIGQLKKALFVFANLRSHLRSSNVLTALESDRNRVGLLTGFQTKILNSSGYCPNAFYLWKSKTSQKHVLPKLDSYLHSFNSLAMSRRVLRRLQNCACWQYVSKWKYRVRSRRSSIQQNVLWTRTRSTQ